MSGVGTVMTYDLKINCSLSHMISFHIVRRVTKIVAGITNIRSRRISIVCTVETMYN